MTILKEQGVGQPGFVEVDFFNPQDIEAFSGFGLWGKHHARVEIPHLGK